MRSMAHQECLLRSGADGTRLDYMDATKAMHETNDMVSKLIAGLTSEHREMATPCEKWNVHELIEHMVSGGHMMAGGLEGQAPPEEMPDFLADGPANGWTNMYAHLSDAATPERLGSLHQMPFGEVPGEAALSVIVADHLTHGWDLAQATGQDFSCSDEIAQWALAVWHGLVPPEGRTGETFGPAVDPGEDASAIDNLIGYTGRQP